jgi:hypothetical protein
MLVRERLLRLSMGCLAGILSFAGLISFNLVDAPAAGAATATCSYSVLLAHADGSVSVEAPSSPSCTSTSYQGSMAGQHLNAPIVGMATTPDGGGYWLVGADGGIFSFGDAAFYGSTGALHLNAPIVGIASTPDGRGYFLVAADGGVFAFGDAQFAGSTGGLHLNQPMVGIAADGPSGGYWMVASDGGVFAFNAPFLGSEGGQHLNAPIRFITGTPDFGGYRMVGADGGVFNFGDAQYYGSAAGQGSQGWQALTSTPDGQGYWLFSNAGQGDGVTVAAFGDATTALTTGADLSTSPLVGAATDVASVAPTVTANPSNETVSDGATATFTAAAVGQPQPGVQWQVSTGGGSYSDVPGATSPTLSFTASPSESGDLYQATFSNSSGSATTTAATLTVTGGAGTVTPSSMDGYFASVSCPGSGDCVAVGGTQAGGALIEYLASGGATWATAPVPTAAVVMHSVDCNDALHCVAVGGNSAMVTTDGGTSWTFQPISVLAPSTQPGVTISYALDGVACASDTACTAVGIETISGQIGVTDAIFIYSTDGGNTWTNSPSGGAESASVTCTTALCIAVGEGPSRSTDAGQDWQAVSFGNQGLSDVACTTDASACLTIGTNPAGISTPTDQGQLGISTDGGQTWTDGATNLPASTATIQAVACGGTTVCMIVGPPISAGGPLVVATSQNSGSTWTAPTGPSGFVEPNNQFPYPGLACTGPADCVVAGAGATGPLVEVTSNGGATWTSQPVQ